MGTTLVKRTIVAAAAGVALVLTTAAGCGPTGNPPGVEQSDDDGGDGDGGDDDGGAEEQDGDEDGDEDDG